MRFFCAAGDNCAMGLLTVAREQGVRIPEDIAIVVLMTC